MNCRANGTRPRKTTARSSRKIRIIPASISAWRECCFPSPIRLRTFKEQAKKELQQELEIDPANAGAEYVLGELARQTNDFPEAVQHFTKATKYRPELRRRLPRTRCISIDGKEVRRSSGSAWKWPSNSSPATPRDTTAWPPRMLARDEKKMRSANSPCSSKPQSIQAIRGLRIRSELSLRKRSSVVAPTFPLHPRWRCWIRRTAKASLK